MMTCFEHIGKQFEKYAMLNKIGQSIQKGNQLAFATSPIPIL